MSLVTLVSGGLDSTLLAILTKEEGIVQHPLFVDYGQLCMTHEWRACGAVHKKYGLPQPSLMRLHGYGHMVPSGITSASRRLNEDAFLPGRNVLFLLAGAGYACRLNASGVAIGLLHEQSHIFPDQTVTFLRKCEDLLGLALGRRLRVVAPLMGLSKGDVLDLCRERHIAGTYSCHSGAKKPCGRCVSCVEVNRARQKGE
jgi:7-cyano-7-deazaguanine synthase